LEQFIEDDKDDLDAMFDEYAYDKSQVYNLAHNSDKFAFGSKLDKDHLLTMIPGQLTLAREKMQQALMQMQANLNYYTEISRPMHDHRDFD